MLKISDWISCGCPGPTVHTTRLIQKSNAHYSLSASDLLSPAGWILKETPLKGWQRATQSITLSLCPPSEGNGYCWICKEMELCISAGFTGEDQNRSLTVLTAVRTVGQPNVTAQGVTGDPTRARSHECELQMMMSRQLAGWPVPSSHHEKNGLCGVTPGFGQCPSHRLSFLPIWSELVDLSSQKQQSMCWLKQFYSHLKTVWRVYSSGSWAEHSKSEMRTNECH